jgi:outer membrane cobalamin receptor
MSPARTRCLLMLMALEAAHGPAQAQSIDYGALEQLFQEPVTTSATGSPQRVADVPANMQIVTAEDIRRSGAWDLPGILRHVTGVEFQQWSGDQPEIGVRGYDQPFSQRVLVLINGRQVYADDDSFTPWSSLPVELGAIRQIEIVSGPGSALFGFDAVGGVINIITYDPLYDDVDVASVSAGSQQLAQGSASVTLPLGKARRRSSLRRRALRPGFPECSRRRQRRSHRSHQPAARSQPGCIPAHERQHFAAGRGQHDWRAGEPVQFCVSVRFRPF